MNRFLADSLGALNALIALALVGAGAVLGYTSAAAVGQDAALGGLVGGGVVGALGAVLICGALALLIAIREEVSALRLALVENSGGGRARAPASTPHGRGEPLRATRGNGAAPGARLAVDGEEIRLQRVNDRELGRLGDGRVVLRTRIGDLRTFPDLESAERYTGRKLS
jgi:hypothetical protein